ncbi:unnamed protein product [Camellia sinensis]
MFGSKVGLLLKHLRGMRQNSGRKLMKERGNKGWRGWDCGGKHLEKLLIWEEQQQLKALEDMPAKSASGTQSQNEDFLAKHTIFNEGNSLKGRCQSLFSFLRVIPAFTESFSESDEDDLKTDAFSQMHKLRLLQLNNIRLSGRYQKFPKKLRWLCWHGFPLKSIPNDFTLDSLVALEMQNSSLTLEENQVAQIIENPLSQLFNSLDFSQLPNLERLILKYYINLVGIHESIGELGALVLLNLEGCKNLSFQGKFFWSNPLNSFLVDAQCWMGCPLTWARWNL